MTTKPPSRAGTRARPSGRSSGRSRSRTVSPLEVRAWVIEMPPEHIYTELLRRIDALETGITPHRDLFIRAGRMLVESALKRMGWPSALPDLPKEAEAMAVRGGAADIVARYWAEREYRSGHFLPPVMIRGGPWDTFPDAVHLLDLDADRIRQALLGHIRGLEHLDPGALDKLSEEPSDALVLLGAATRLIHTLGPLAVFDRVVHVALYTWLMAAHYAPTKEAAEFGADAAAGLLDAFKPDLSRHVTRTPESLKELHGVFKDILEKADRVQQVLHAEGPTSRVLARARAELGPRISRSDLARWHRMGSRAIAIERLARVRHRSVKSTKEQLRLAEKSADIDEAWDEFLAYLRTLSEAQQQRIMSALPPLLSFPTPQPGSPPKA